MPSTQGRNEMCGCGSGKKYKRCCIDKPSSPEPTDEDLRRLHKESNDKFYAPRVWREIYGQIKPIIHTDIQQRKLVAVGNRLFISKPYKWKYFNEFLEDYLLSIFGKSWFDTEIAYEFDDRHIILKWRKLMWEYLSTHLEREGDDFGAQSNGAAKAYLQLAYDLYILGHNATLQAELVKRLKSKEHFQGARYECFVASIFVKAGFEINFENESDPRRKHPEFVATHPRNGIKIAVEAKSRHRPGVLHLPGARVDDPILGIKNLLWKAFEKVENYPYVIFVDLNLPPDVRQVFENEWFKEVPESIDQLIESHHLSSEPFNFIFFTNYPYHYVGPNDEAPQGDYFGTISQKPKNSGDYEWVFHLLMNTLKHYGYIPNKYEDAD